MSDLAVRLAVVVLVVGIPVTAVLLARRRPGRVRTTAHLAPGITVFVAPGCRLCGPAIDALHRAAATPDIVRAPDGAFDELRVRSVPTAVVVGEGGRVLARRSGPAVAADAAVLAATAERAAEQVSPRRPSRRDGR